MTHKGFLNAFADVVILDGVRTPMVDYCGALGHISPTDLGIKAAREALARAGVPGDHIGSVVTGNMAPGDFDQFFLQGRQVVRLTALTTFVGNNDRQAFLGTGGRGVL